MDLPLHHRTNIVMVAPQDVKPGDVGNKRGMWETKKSSTPAKVIHTHTHMCAHTNTHTHTDIYCQQG